MPIYFFPERKHDGSNYYGYTKKGAKPGRRVTAQMPCEGIYTKHECAQFSPAMPGVWRMCKAADVGYVFGLRQFLGTALPPEWRVTLDHIPARTPRELAEWLRGLDDGCNAEGELCRQAAEQLDALARIHAEMDGREWGSETAESIAGDLRGIGLEVRDLGECDCDSRSWHGEEHDTACPLAGLSRVTQ